jgi:hypothetical protein
VLAALKQLTAQLPALASMDLTRMSSYACAEHMLQALGSSASQLTWLHMNVYSAYPGYPEQWAESTRLVQTLRSLKGLCCLGLNLNEWHTWHPELSSITQVTQLRVLGRQVEGHATDATLGMWSAAMSPHTQLQVLSISAELLSGPQPWLAALSQLVVLELLPWGYNFFPGRPWPAKVLPEAVQHVRQAVVVPGAALQLVVVSPYLPDLQEVMAALLEGGWPSQVAVSVGTRAWLAAAGREAWPPQLWRVLKEP